MKKIFLLSLFAIVASGAAFAQKGVSVAEKDVPSRMVIDFQRQQIDAREVSWMKIDSLTYEVRFIDGDNGEQGIRYTPRGTENRYYFSTSNCPRSIQDSVKAHYPKFKITNICVRNAKRQSSYEARIARMGGFLFWKKEKEAKTLHFDVFGKFLDEE